MLRVCVNASPQTTDADDALIEPLQHRTEAVRRIIAPINTDLPVVTPRRIAGCVVMERFDVVDVFPLTKVYLAEQPLRYHIADEHIGTGIAGVFCHRVFGGGVPDSVH